MQTGSPMGSAQIIPFPVRGRASVGALDIAQASSARAAAFIYDAAFASSWYHEDAVVDDRQAPKS